MAGWAVAVRFFATGRVLTVECRMCLPAAYDPMVNSI